MIYFILLQEKHSFNTTSQLWLNMQISGIVANINQGLTMLILLDPDNHPLCFYRHHAHFTDADSEVKLLPKVTEPARSRTRIQAQAIVANPSLGKNTLALDDKDKSSTSPKLYTFNIKPKATWLLNQNLLDSNPSSERVTSGKLLTSLKAKKTPAF